MQTDVDVRYMLVFIRCGVLERAGLCVCVCVRVTAGQCPVSSAAGQLASPPLPDH